MFAVEMHPEGREWHLYFRNDVDARLVASFVNEEDAEFAKIGFQKREDALVWKHLEQEKPLPSLQQLDLGYGIVPRLQRKGICDVAELLKRNELQLLEIKGIGATSIWKIRAALGQYGLHLSGETVEIR